MVINKQTGTPQKSIYQHLDGSVFISKVTTRNLSHLAEYLFIKPSSNRTSPDNALCKAWLQMTATYAIIMNTMMYFRRGGSAGKFSFTLHAGDRGSIPGRDRPKSLK